MIARDGLHAGGKGGPGGVGRVTFHGHFPSRTELAEAITPTAHQMRRGLPVSAQSAAAAYFAGSALPGSVERADFDKLFVELMIAHHEGVVAMAEEHHAEGRNAAAVIDTQTTEIATLQEIQARL
ncbi:hypothetical protein GCM10027447_21080 [Glycomyces halotolerans]